MSKAIYKKTALGTLVAIIGALVIIAGILLLFDEKFIFGALVIALGFSSRFLTREINERKAVQRLQKTLREQCLEQQMATSFEVAAEAYRRVPCKKTLDYIATINPHAAETIRKTVK